MASGVGRGVFWRRRIEGCSGDLFSVMNRTLLIIRIFFILLCGAGSWLLWYATPEWERHQALVVVIGLLIGSLVILVDLLLKGFSLRGLSALTFGLGVGAVIAFFISSSPLFEHGEEQIVFLSRLGLFVICMYLGAVIALRGKDEFNLVIPYVRFVPHNVDVPLVVVDTSALIDGRIVHVCRTHFMNAGLIIPQFVLDELRRIADSSDPLRKAKGRRGLESLNLLKEMDYVDLRVEESAVGKGKNVDAKLIFLANSLKAKLLTTDYNLARMAEFHGIVWLNLNALSKALISELTVGEVIEVELVKEGKEPNQAVGYLDNGSMVVVNEGRGHLHETVPVEIISVLPSSGGKLVFGRMLEDYFAGRPKTD